MSKPIKPPTDKEFTWLSTLTVDPDLGKVYNQQGKEIGFNAGGYIKLGHSSEGKWRYFKRSHIIWWAKYGIWPEANLDHKDRTKTNDVIDNLRYTTYIQNALNCEQYHGQKGLPRGVCYDMGTNTTRPYKASIVDAGIKRFLGRYSTAEEASQAWQQADAERRTREANNQRRHHQ